MSKQTGDTASEVKPKKFDICYLHIGTEKTGTTSIQEFLSKNRANLLKQGFFYPRSLGEANHVKIAAYAAADESLDDIRKNVLFQYHLPLVAFRQYLREEFAAEIEETQANRLIVSSEHCHSRLPSLKEKQRLRDFFELFCKRIHIVVYLRRQDKVACSLYSTRFKSGGIDFENILPNPRKHGEFIYYYDYQALLKGYTEVFGKENITVRIFEEDKLEDNNVIKDIFSILGCSDYDSFSPPVKSNESLLPVAQKFLSIFNRYVPEFIGNQPNTLRGNIVSLLEKHYSGKGRLPSRSQAHAFYDSFRECNAWVAQEFFSGQLPLFSEDFTDYPEEGTLDSFSIEEIIRLSAILWQEKQQQMLALRKS